MNTIIKNYLGRLAGSGRGLKSFLFVGPDEIEKEEAAFYFVSKLSERADDKDFLRKIKEKIHPDVNIIEPEIVEDKKGQIREKEILIEQVREVLAKLKFFPYELEKKFCIIKKAQRMNAESSNLLLKTLEEPAESAFFILLAGDADLVLPTISSRCAVLRFPQTALPVWNEENREKLRRIFREEIFERFDYIEKKAKDKNEMIRILEDWEAITAEALRKVIFSYAKSLTNKEDQLKIKKVISIIESIRRSVNQLEDSNASHRAVGEKLMLEI